jgi:hypothetical protein
VRGFLLNGDLEMKSPLWLRPLMYLPRHVAAMGTAEEFSHYVEPLPFCTFSEIRVTDINMYMSSKYRLHLQLMPSFFLMIKPFVIIMIFLIMDRSFGL